MLNSLVCYTHLWLARVRGHITCIVQCDMRDILTILTNDSGGPVANAIPQIPHYNGGVALHICRVKTVEEFVSETVYAVCHKKLASLLLRANSPSETFVTFPHLSTSSFLLSALSPWLVRTIRETHILHSIARGFPQPVSSVRRHVMECTERARIA